MNKNLLQTLSQLAEQGEQLVPIAGYDGMHVKIHTVGSLNAVSERAQELRNKYPNDPYLSERLAVEAALSSQTPKNLAIGKPS